MKNLILTSTVLMFFVSCSSTALNNVKKLSPGMGVDEVTQLLGEPDAKHFMKGKYIYEYELKKLMEVPYPYYLVFDKDTMKLEKWMMDANSRAIIAQAQANSWNAFGQHMQQYNQQQMNSRVQPVATPTRIHCSQTGQFTNCTQY